MVQFMIFMALYNQCMTQLMTKFPPIHCNFGAGFIFFAHLGPFNYSLVDLQLSRPYLWPAETKYTLNKLTSLVWISSRITFWSYKLFSLVFPLLVLPWSLYDVMQFSNWSVRFMVVRQVIKWLS